MRGTAILALRDVFTGTDVTYNKYLRPIIVEALTTSLRDSATENRRAALNTFNAASRNKPDLVLPQMHHLLPLVLDQTLEDPSLIREVSMGPFRHKVDDGLEVRKVRILSLLELPVLSFALGCIRDIICPPRTCSFPHRLHEILSSGRGRSW